MIYSEKTVKGLKGQITDLETKVKGLENDKETLSAEKTAAETKNKEYERLANTQDSEIITYKTREASYDKRITELSGNLDAANQDLAVKVTEITSLNSRIEELKKPASIEEVKKLAADVADETYKALLEGMLKEFSDLTYKIATYKNITDRALFNNWNDVKLDERKNNIQLIFTRNFMKHDYGENAKYAKSKKLSNEMFGFYEDLTPGFFFTNMGESVKLTEKDISKLVKEAGLDDNRKPSEGDLIMKYDFSRDEGRNDKARQTYENNETVAVIGIRGDEENIFTHWLRRDLDKFLIAGAYGAFKAEVEQNNWKTAAKIYMNNVSGNVGNIFVDAMKKTIEQNPGIAPYMYNFTMNMKNKE
jgi:hypothetical protein